MSYQSYDPDTGEWYEVPRMVYVPPGFTGTAPAVQVGLPDGTTASRPARGLRRHRADTNEDVYRQ